MNGVKVFRDFLTPHDQLIIDQKIRLPYWRFFHHSGNSTEEKPFWSMDNLEHDDFFGVYLFNKVKETIGQNHVMERVYMNGHVSGSNGYLHTDSEVSNGRTFLIYCNQTWSANFGGSTYFVNGNEMEYFYPHPFSAICFQNNILHGAQPISTDFKGLRVTLAYKLFKV